MARTSQNSTHFALEQYVNAVEQQGGILTDYPVVINNSLTTDSLEVASPTVATSGTVAATLGDTGGSTGPATAAQNSWLELNVDGTNYYLPLWK